MFLYLDKVAQKVTWEKMFFCYKLDSEFAVE